MIRMKFNKSNCRILRLGWSNAGHEYKWGEEWLESSPAGRVLECTQRRPTELGKGLEGMSCEGRPRALGLPGLERRRLRANLIALCSFLRRGRGEGGAELSSLGSSNRTHGNGSELRQGRFRLDTMKHFCTERVVKPWDRLARDGVDTPSLSI